ncbi:hypothetical protein [Pseudoalteromonas peptidolytica]|uniref:Uncharacterized protein n=1 Tax=Pseudoalteromonas peptidolytica F12-50-A1 TaxID=1315280 RepID=A0A8I0MXF9_9GAMM|nr:hypothetical protein [Pseudoalteromonas peptidolytica]MBE0347782.1 hypothetical protein [Pseudoalteromonas peptidolytica F12-50-A1]NLR16831.1 hypothetical protein [Pseudoalteromonas peptidolytica]GEK09713.1 hypothetical protein PPE03_19620 [Pseudoalteromonas peptidolytica]
MKKVDNDAEYFAWFAITKNKCTQFIYQQPALLMTLGYLTLNLSGFTYLWSLFDAFSIEIIKYMELSDFVMAFLAEPSILLASLGAIIVGGGGVYFISKINIKLSDANAPEGWKSWLLSNRLFYCFNPFYSLVVIATLIYPNIYAGVVGKWNAQSIKQGVMAPYNVDLINPVHVGQFQQYHFQNMQIIFESGRYLFLFEHSKGRTVIFARDNIASIQMATQGVDN